MTAEIAPAVNQRSLSDLNERALLRRALFLHCLCYFYLTITLCVVVQYANANTDRNSRI